MELAGLASVRMAVGSETEPGRMDVELMELQAVPRLERQGAGLKERMVQAPVSAVRRARKRPALVAFESPELVAELRPVRRKQQAWLPRAGQERRVQRRGPERQVRRKVAQRRPEEQRASDGRLLRRHRALASQTLRRTRRLRQLAPGLEWRCELFQQRRPVSSWSESFSP